MGVRMEQQAVLLFGLAQVFLGVVARLPQLLLFQSSSDGNRKAFQIVFKDIVTHSSFYALYGDLVAQGSGDQNERNIAPRGPHPFESIHSIPIGQTVIGEDEIIPVRTYVLHEVV